MEVVFTVIFKKDGRYLASPTVLGQFGQDVRVEVASEMRAVVRADAPDALERSHTAAQFFLFQDGDWQLIETMTMDAFLRQTPSFQHSIPGTPYRFEVYPRMIVPPAG